MVGEALEAVKMANELREQVSGLGAELAEARKRAKENMEPSVEEVEEVNALRVRVAELEGVNATLGQRARGSIGGHGLFHFSKPVMAIYSFKFVY
jgi:hypothetical protein